MRPEFKLLCLLGIHRWHPTARIFDGYKVSKEICTRCSTRRVVHMTAPAKAMEARRATTGTGVVHDSAAPQGFAQGISEQSS